jgi:hypothetical protein
MARGYSQSRSELPQKKAEPSYDKTIYPDAYAAGKARFVNEDYEVMWKDIKKGIKQLDKEGEDALGLNTRPDLLRLRRDLRDFVSEMWDGAANDADGDTELWHGDESEREGAVNFRGYRFDFDYSRRADGEDTNYDLTIKGWKKL